MSKDYLDKEGLAKLWSRIKKYIANKDIKTATPVGGSIVWYGSEDTIPSDWMREDGRSLNKNDYPDLFAAIGYTYGGSGNNFNIPNSKGRVVVHLDESDNDFKTLGNKYGWKTHNHSLTKGYAMIDFSVYSNYMTMNYIPGQNFESNWRCTLTGQSMQTITEENKMRSDAVRLGGTTDNSSSCQPSIIAYKIIKVKEDAYTKDLRNLDNAINNHISYQHGCITLGLTEDTDIESQDSGWSFTKVLFDKQVNSNNDLFEVSQSSVKIKRAGYYKLSGCAETDIKANDLHKYDQMQIRIVVNDVNVMIMTSHCVYQYVSGSQNTDISGASIGPAVFKLEKDDIVEMRIGYSSVNEPHYIRHSRTFLTVETC